MNSHITLGIETSCDETAAAVYHEHDGLLSSIISSHADMHKLYGGVVPELESRNQLKRINPIVSEALQAAQVSLDDINTVAVTNRPGLPGSLLVGTAFAKGLAWSAQKKIIGVNHLEGHAFSVFLDHDVPFPHICMTASGGHTSIYLVHDFGVYDILGQTIDDAAGEAFDKIARSLGWAYPGGPYIEKAAALMNFQDFYHYPRSMRDKLDFSFSGLKTAVLYDLVNKGLFDLKTKTLIKKDEQIIHQVASSLQVCIADIFVQKVKLAKKLHPNIKAITFVGGVACNKYIVRRLSDVAARYRLPFFSPSPKNCTDNAAMIAFVGNYKAQQGAYDQFDLDIKYT